MTTMHDDDGNEYGDDDNDGDDDDHDLYGHDEFIMNIADSRVVLGTIVHTYDCNACNGSSTSSMHCLHSS